MARKLVTTTEYTDDLDGSTAAGTISFGYEGQQYEIDLSKANAKAFEKVMALYVGHARKVRASRGRASSRRSGGGASQKYDLAAVRQWAAENGFEVSDRGRVAAAVLEAYEAAQ